MTMKERIARAILKRRFYDCEPDMYGGDLDRFFAEIDSEHMHEARDEAEAVLDAMREPTGIMALMGAGSIELPSIYGEIAWQVMIDAAKAGGTGMSETVIPTMSLRYAKKSLPVPGYDYLYETRPVLQQRFDKPSGGHEWRDVPTIEDEAEGQPE